MAGPILAILYSSVADEHETGSRHATVVSAVSAVISSGADAEIDPPLHTPSTVNLPAINGALKVLLTRC
jgi:hypothetical protein